MGIRKQLRTEYVYAGYTWTKKGIRRRTLFWNRLGYNVKIIPVKNGKFKSRYKIYVKKKFGGKR